jgi:hypothetical protein
MKRDNSKPTLQARLQATAQLLDKEADKLEGYVRERDRDTLTAVLQAGWREVSRIRARAMVQGMLEVRTGRQTG